MPHPIEPNHFKILIADDSLLNQEALRRILIPDDPAVNGHDGAHYTVITAKSGSEALEQVYNDRPDLILLDIVMPGMDGFEVMTRLKDSDATRSIPVIVVSGLTNEEDEERGFMLGAVDYITKPFKKSIVIARIKTHLKIVEQMRLIEQISLVDDLTRIPNRRNFDKCLKTEWKRAVREKTPLGLLMVDVDHFKSFNDTYGHRQGDETLKTVALTLSSMLRRPADIAARWGGEEFTVLLPNTGQAGTVHVAEQIRTKIEDTRIRNISDSDDNSPLSVTVSIGAASITPSSEDTIECFIEQADKAMYNAKKTGRNKVCVPDEMEN